MAKTKEISFTAGRVIGQPNFGSARFEHSETIIVEEGDDLGAVTEDLRKRVLNRLYKDVAPYFNKSA